jgi:ABC-type antimicrobial peptide transport system permease subunit
MVESPSVVFETIKAGLSDADYGFPFIWGQLNPTGLLTERAILLILGIFGIFIIYSLFQISVRKRTAEYSVLQTLGMTDPITFGVLLVEMGMLSLVGYPIGALLGNGVAGLIYRSFGKIFIVQEQARHTGIGMEQQLERMAINLPDAGDFQISWSVFSGGAVYLVIVLFVLSWMLIRRMKKQTIWQMIIKDNKKKLKSRKIHSIRRSNMAGVLTNKFMFSRKGTFVGILMSLSVGSIIFLGAAYTTENTKINNELTLKADDGLGSDLQVYEESDQIVDVMPEKVVNELKQVDGLQSVHGVRYLLGETPLEDGSLLWTSYFAEIAADPNNKPNPILKEKYNGVINQTGEDDYAMRINIYGYDDAMLKEMEPYILEGTIDPEQMRKDNSVIYKTLMDGQGNFGGITIKTQDMVSIKTIKDKTVPQEALRFLGEDAWYQNRKMKVAAIASRPLAVIDTFIGDNYDNCIDIIMTNEQMEQNFGVSDYRTISISLKEGTDADSVIGKIKDIISGIPKCVIKDYTDQIEAQNVYLTQKMMFFYGTAAIFFGISILHIMNSMQYLVAARKHEFGIIRAMGITDWGFCKMLAKEGLRYGIYSSMVVGILFLIVQRILHYFMVHVYLYLHPRPMISWIPLAGVVAVNLVICVGVVLFAGRSILKNQIIDEIRL